MAWNYRIIKTNEDDIASYAIHEVHYDERGRPKGYSAWAASATADTTNGINKALAMMRKATALPVMEDQNGKLVEIKPVEEKV